MRRPGLLAGTGAVILRFLQTVGEVLLLLGQAVRASRAAPRNVDKILARQGGDGEWRTRQEVINA